MDRPVYDIFQYIRRSSLLAYSSAVLLCTPFSDHEAANKAHDQVQVPSIQLGQSKVSGKGAF